MDMVEVEAVGLRRIWVVAVGLVLDYGVELQFDLSGPVAAWEIISYCMWSAEPWFFVLSGKCTGY